jgi:hypothetical protein
MTVMSELLPFTAYNEYQNMATGEQLSYPDGLLTVPERNLVVRHVDIALEWIEHGYLAEDKAIVKRVIEAHNPRTTVILHEGADAPANPARQATSTTGLIDAFGYGRALAKEQGFQVFGADMNRRQFEAWQHLQESSGADTLPFTSDVLFDLFAYDFQALDFFEATATYLASQRNTNMRDGSQTIFRESAFHNERERITANTLKTLAVTIAKWHHANDKLDKSTIVLLYGPAHQEPIEERLRQLDLPYQSTNHSGRMRWEAIAQTNMVTGITAYEFAKHFFYFHIGLAAGPMGIEARQRQQKDTWDQIDVMPLDGLRDVYEIFRRYLTHQDVTQRAHELSQLLGSCSQEGL